jgi:hypothetical protein
VLLAADRFVSNGGSDTGVGDAAHPWATLQYAADHVAAGDAVNVLPGNYTGAVVDSSHSGTADQRISFLGQSGANITTPGRFGDGIRLEGASYITIQGFNASNMTGSGIRSGNNTGVIIRNNKCDNNGVWGIFTGHSDNILIEYNECSRSHSQHGIYFSNSADNPIIRGNIIWGNYGNGIHMNGDVSIPPGDGIIKNALVEGNIIYDNGTGGGSGINMCGVQDTIVRNNLIYNQHASGISMYLGEGAEGCKRDIIVNNTILVASNGRSALNIKANPAGTGNVFMNNILYTANSTHTTIADDGTNLDYLSDYNLVTDRYTLNDYATILTLSQWQGQTGKDTHSQAISSTDLNNLFVDVANNDYRFKAGSMAINAGTSYDAPAWDLAGNPRPMGGQYDIGAYEYFIVPGDANLDGKVSFADYLALESNFGKTGMGWMDGDFNGDQKVSFADYLILEAGFGKSAPEPASLAMLALGGLAMLRRR